MKINKCTNQTKLFHLSFIFTSKDSIVLNLINKQIINLSYQSDLSINNIFKNKLYKNK